jgi:hypothetical protein
MALAGALIWDLGPAQATPAFAQKTKQGCQVCHQMPPGKTNLTPRGKQFQDSGATKGPD